MSHEIVPLTDKHLSDAAALVAARYRSLREHAPSMPSRYQDANVILPWLSDLARQAPGVAAIHGGRLVGFLVGHVIPEFRGERTVFSPEWANAADLLNSRQIYQEMYANLSGRWAANGCFTHLICMLAHDQEGIQGWHWQGFGLIAADAVRDLRPIQETTAGIDIRQGSSQDLDQAIRLTDALQRHLAAAPTFLAYTHRAHAAWWEEWFASPANALWLALEETQAVAFMKQEPPVEHDVSVFFRDDRSTSITGAFTAERLRGRGIATALLNQVLGRARCQHCERCAVSFEPRMYPFAMNVPAARFWMRHFQPVCYGLVRHVNKQVAWANERRDAADEW